jgi:SAM-dependent methyltransferase
MGLDQKQVRFVLKLLARQQAAGLAPSLFEIGYGCGVLLEHVHRQGYPVAGIEVSPVLRAQALRRLGREHEQDLLLGNLVGAVTSGLRQRFSLIYWNDVLEHIAPDEVRDYLQRIADLLRPGGQLVTITPNWHMRPSDITREIHPPRTTAAGLHLQEYTLGQVTGLLWQAGFRPVTVPLCVLPGRVVTLGGGLASIKRLFEPGLEGMPFGLAELLCRGLGLSYTIATKPSARAAKDPC